MKCPDEASSGHVYKFYGIWRVRHLSCVVAIDDMKLTAEERGAEKRSKQLQLSGFFSATEVSAQGSK